MLWPLAKELERRLTMDNPEGKNAMEVNDEWAQRVRRRLGAAHVAGVNLMSAPGSGKTTLIEAALQSLRGVPRIAVLEGDPHATLDVARIAGRGARVKRIDTAAGRPLDAKQVDRALEHFDLASVDLLLIENSGNLGASAEFDLGESYRVALLNVMDGQDQPDQYPKLFRTADLVILNKIDLLPQMRFNLVHFSEALNRLHPNVPVLQVSCRAGTGIPAWCAWLRKISGTAS